MTLDNNCHDDFINALVNSWMTKNEVFNDDQTVDKTDSPDGKKIVSSWEVRWDFLNVYFHRITINPMSNSSNVTVEQYNVVSDEVNNVVYRWRDKLYSIMREPRRYYHTHIHVEEMLGYMDIFLSHRDAILQIEQQQGKELSETRGPSDMTIDTARATMILATLFHDAIYDPKSNTNEEDSATLYCTFASELSQAMLSGKGQPLDFANTSGSVITSPYFDFDRVQKYILATKYHNIASSDDIYLKLFLDADMAVLGKQDIAYDVYAGLIRQEYIHVDRSVYCQKRAEVLLSFLSHDTIFASQIMKDAFEVQARKNLSREIELLSRDIIPGEMT